MKKDTQLKKYVELFKKRISRYLAAGINIKTIIYPVDADGAVFEFQFNHDNDSSVTIDSVRPTVGRVLSDIPQRMVGGNIEGVKFGGTNLYLEGNRILVIKGEDDPPGWSGKAVVEDVQRVVSTSQGGKPA